MLSVLKHISLSRVFNGSVPLKLVRPFCVIGFGALLLNILPAYAANECGAGAAGSTVTCNNDGSPASDTSPYNAGITYTTAVNLVVDGTVNPITTTGRIGVTSNAGPQSTTVIGNVTQTRTNPASAVAGIGDSSAHARDISLNIGPDVTSTTTSTSSRTIYSIAAHASNAKITAQSYADVIISTTVGAGSRAYSFSDTTGGTNGGVDVTIGGSIDIDTNGGSNIYGIFASTTGLGSPSVSVNSSADIDITTTGSLTGSAVGIVAQNTGGDSFLSSSGNVTISVADSNSLIRGLFAHSANGQVVIDSSGVIDVRNTSTAYGISLTGAADNIYNVTNDITAISSGAGAYGVASQSASKSNNMRIGDNVSVIVSGTAASTSTTPVGLWLNGGLTGGNILNAGENVLVDTTTGGTTNSFGVVLGNGAYDVSIGQNSTVNSTNTGIGSAFGIYIIATSAGGTIYLAEDTSLSAVANDGLAIAFSGSDGLDNFTSYADIVGNLNILDGADTVSLLGGSLQGAINMDSGDDELNINDLDDAGLSGITHLDGGNGEDVLTFTNIDYSGASLAADDLSQGINLMNGWETINFVNSDWTLTGNLTLGGSTVNIDSTSTLYAGNGINSVISSVVPNDPAVVNNAGVIDMTNGTSGATDRLRIVGDYVGAGGIIRMNVATGAGGVESDRLIVDGSNGGGSITGTSVISLIDSQFLGGPTSGNGILLVQTVGGATSAANAFTLDTSYLAVGAYSYMLDLNAGNDNWYLVSAPGARNGIVADVTLPDLSHRLGLAMLGRMDDRHNDDGGKFWIRTFGQFGQVGETGNFAAHGPEFDYTLAGTQMGVDLYRTPLMEKTRDIIGVYGATGHVKADVASPAGGEAGVSQMTAYGLGAYWTHHAAQGWYIDTSAQATFYDNVSSRGGAGEALTTHGYGYLASVEGGKPYRLKKNVMLTPQVQVTAQKTKLDDSGDSFGRVDFRDANAVYTRAGAKLTKTLDLDDGPLFKHGPIDVWLMPGVAQSFGADAKTVVTDLSGGNAASFRTDLGGSALLLNAGISARFTENLSLFTAAEYSTALSRGGNALAGKAGIKIAW